MIEHRYLFFIDKSEIEVYSFENGKFIKVKFKGEDVYFGKKEDFWNEWEAKAGYIDESISRVDFCVIGKDEVFTKQNKYRVVKKTIWNKNEIQNFLKEIKNLNTKIIDGGALHIKIGDELKRINIYTDKLTQKIREEKDEEVDIKKEEPDIKKEEPDIKKEEPDIKKEECVIQKKEKISIADFYRLKKKNELNR